ncbi:hypothetical protein P168DRAFT_332898 [Aspergillus campestris IBT 28561]|uniref:Uncharacterized protein n=1 Tax=Aspergillus campestris (strain IBT 28561) TaxID=1392248 RepID=A0A2I1DHE5_ASPC2|nr:uncharacterized protein P168DRAFT_332898 [Aspergillus campestris IBT 28561]PKY09290.1 hypothetical protein P168DRAFT_332898 [Aspergillus campestris IBT 28561]
MRMNRGLREQRIDRNMHHHASPSQECLRRDGRSRRMFNYLPPRSSQTRQRFQCRCIPSQPSLDGNQHRNERKEPEDLVRQGRRYPSPGHFATRHYNRVYLLGLDILILLPLAIYAAGSSLWTEKLDSFAMMRIGAVVAEKVPFLVGRGTDKIEALDEIPGWVGDTAEGSKILVCIYKIPKQKTWR